MTFDELIPPDRYKINGDTGCFEWQLSFTGGRPTLHLDGHNHLARPLIARVVLGLNLDGMDVRSTCENKICVNPAHIFAAPRAHRASKLRKSIDRAGLQKKLPLHKPEWLSDREWNVAQLVIVNEHSLSETSRIVGMSHRGAGLVLRRIEDKIERSHPIELISPGAKELARKARKRITSDKD